MWTTPHYIIGSVAGPHPYPLLVREFQSVIGVEVRAQCLEQEGRLPDLLVACVGGGSNAMGLFHPFVEDEEVDMVGVEAGGHGLATRPARRTAQRRQSWRAARCPHLCPWTTTTARSWATHSISAGLDYPGVGPEHSHWKDIGRARYGSVTDEEALEAFRLLNRTEGIMPGARIEPRHRLCRGRGTPPPGQRPDRGKPLWTRRQGHPDRGRGGRDRTVTATRLALCLDALKQAERKALNAFITAGDPTRAATVPAMHALVRGGADIVELGVPFFGPRSGWGPGHSAFL